MPRLMGDSVEQEMPGFHDLLGLPLRDGEPAPGLAPPAEQHANSTACTTCGVKTTAGFPVCFSCMMGSEEPIRLVSSERKRSRADVSFAESLRSLSGPSRFPADETDGPALVESGSDISDSLSDSLSEDELSPKRRRSSIPRPRRPSFDDILDTLPEPLTGSIALFGTPARPMSPPALDLSEGEGEQHFMFPTPPLRTPTTSPTKHGFIPTETTVASPSAIPIVNFPFKETVATVQSSRRPSLATGLSADERASLKSAGKGAVIMRVTEDLNKMMSQLFAC